MTQYWKDIAEDIWDDICSPFKRIKYTLFATIGLKQKLNSKGEKMKPLERIVQIIILLLLVPLIIMQITCYLFLMGVSSIIGIIDDLGRRKV